MEGRASIDAAACSVLSSRHSGARTINRAFCDGQFMESGQSFGLAGGWMILTLSFRGDLALATMAGLGLVS